jgi:hypothetical protein
MIFTTRHEGHEAFGQLFSELCAFAGDIPKLWLNPSNFN